MAGLSRQDLSALALWFKSLGARTRALILTGAALAGLGVVWSVVVHQTNTRLVSAYPDAIPEQRQLLDYGVRHGRGVFETHCAGCHGAAGQGRRSLSTPNLTDKDWLYGEGAVSDIERVVLYGIRAPDPRTWKLADMPAFAAPLPYPREKAIQPLTPLDVDDVLQFLRLIEGRSADGAAAKRGAAIYAGRGGCYDCHASDALGDASIGAPNLQDDIWLYGDGSDAAIKQSITQGRAGVCPAWAGRLSAVRIREAALYVYSLSHGGAQPKPSLP